MTIVLIIVGIIVVLIIVLVAWLYIAADVGANQTINALMSAIKPVVSAIRDGSEVPSDQIRELAHRRDTRSLLFRTFRELDRSDLMPEEYGSLSAIAESDLVVWLLHPHE